MAFLPVLWWHGHSALARGIVHILAAGVFFSGAVKDLLCLPRPLSPPLQRISRSHSAALEYGFPSTHSTNAVSVAIYGIWALHVSDTPGLEPFKPALQVMCYFYALSIVLGRLYCGMHGFFDVIVGIALGAGLALIQIFFGHHLDEAIYHGPVEYLIIVILIVLVLVRTHPEPADDCPCFDDSVAFAGVFIGIETGSYRFARSPYSWSHPVPSTIPYNLEHLGIPKVILRFLLGILVIFLWRASAKTTLLKTLPPLFRIIEHLGLSLPRKFFLQASEYKSVPSLRKDDNIIPPASEIPGMITSLRHPRKRTISIGPQSEADAYETLALRERRTRASRSVSPKGRYRSPNTRSKTRLAAASDTPDGYFSPPPPAAAAGLNVPSQPPSRNRSPTPWSLKKVTSTSSGVLYTPSESPAVEDVPGATKVTDEQGRMTVEEDNEEGENDAMFQQLLKPRVRYDVEVVTKLIVYAGIGWASTEWNPILFELCGLGMGHRP